MKLSELKELLHFFQTQMELAVEQNDWKELSEINSNIVNTLKSLTKEQRENELADVVQQLHETYQNVLRYSDIRREELQTEMSKLRKQKTAMHGYGVSLAAGNQALRTQA